MKYLQYQFKVFCSAVMFLTRIPVPNFQPYNPIWLQQSPRYFTWVGFIIGGLSALVGCLVFKLDNPYLAAVFYTITSILITGAFHEDGFADMCDAFGGGYTIEKKLTIMKDSRIGTYGALGLLLMVALKIILVGIIFEQSLNVNFYFHFKFNANVYLVFGFLAILAHAYSRIAPLLVMQFLPYVADVDASKAKPMANQKIPLLSYLIALIPIFFMLAFAPFLVGFSAIALLVSVIYMYLLCKKHIGGYTGDCLGATQQLAEVLLYLLFIIYFKIF